MFSPPGPKTKMRDLERVRQNQQRSRQRKRAYVLELESKVAQLSAQLDQTSQPPVAPSEESGNNSTLQALARLKCENDARRDLLLALGVGTSAQDLFVRASAIRMAAPQANNTDTPYSPALASIVTQDVRAPLSPLTHAGRPFDSYSGDIGLFVPPPATAERVGSSASNRPDIARPYPDTRQDGQSSHALPTAEPSDALASTEAFTSTLEPSADWDQSVTMYEQLFQTPPYPSKASEVPFEPGLSLDLFEPPGSDIPNGLAQHHGFCTTLWNATAQANDADLAGTTACSIAFSMILKHNARSLPMQQLESRLQVGYRGGQTVGADCRVVNSVLFSVLAEIS
ncbi:hypothetical protein Q7P37_001387 [Cladosporium fusiforme]